MPLFDYRCNACQAVTEMFLRAGEQPRCQRCGGNELTRMVSRFSFKAARTPKYSDDFRQRAMPFLKGQAPELFETGGESEEATAYRLSEQIGERVDRALEQQVFRKI